MSFTDNAGHVETLTSAATNAVAATSQLPTIQPRVRPPSTGTAQGRRDADGGHFWGIADADGLSNVQFEYQWLADAAEIAGATGSTYTLADSEEGEAIAVRVSFTDDAGNDEIPDLRRGRANPQSAALRRRSRPGPGSEAQSRQLQRRPRFPGMGSSKHPGHYP